MSVSAKGVARIRHGSTGVTYEVYPDELDWQETGADEREMGAEVAHLATVDHSELGSLTWELWEYPVGMENHRETDVGDHTLLNDFDLTLAADPDDDELSTRAASLVEWFAAHYEDPAERTPYESAEGGYQWVWGGPYDAHLVLSERFPDEEPSVIDAAVREIEADGIVEWTRASSADDYDTEDEESADEEPPPVRSAVGVDLPVRDRQREAGYRGAIDAAGQTGGTPLPLGIEANRPPPSGPGYGQGGYGQGPYGGGEKRAIAELIRREPPPVLPEAPASLTFEVEGGRIAVSHVPPHADLPPEAVAGMLQVALGSIDEAITTLRNTNADRRLIGHLERLGDGLMTGPPDQAMIFRIGKEPGFLRRQAVTLRDEGNAFGANALEDLAAYLDDCANQFPVWVTFLRNAAAAALTPEQIDLAPSVARLLIAEMETTSGEAAVDPSVPAAFNRLLARAETDAAGAGLEPDVAERRRHAADLLGSIGNFFKRVPEALMVGATEGVAVWLLELLFSHVVPGGGTIIVANFMVNLPSSLAGLGPLIEYLKHIASALGVPVL